MANDPPLDSQPTGRAADLSGRELNDFRLLRRIGQGAMATVYLAEQGSLARRVAVKVLNADLARDEEQVERFKHEARSAASMTHAGVVQVYEVGSSGEHHYFAQEYVPGGSLGDLLRREGRLSPGAVLKAMWQVAEGLAAADQRGLVHRDIKPDNLMIDRSGAVKVADFGLARLAEAGKRMTRAGVALGTPLYMSPEQVEGRELDIRSDLYSLGVTAFHLLSGAPPFDAETPLAVAMQHVNNAPPSLAEASPSTPAALAEIVDYLLAKEPGDRYASPSELIEALRMMTDSAAAEGWAEPSASVGGASSLARAAASRQGLAAQRERLGEAMRNERRATGRRRWWLVGAAALGLIAGVALRPTPLLPATAGAEVPRADTAKRQLLVAKQIDSPEAWRAVARHHPDADRFLQLLATRGLADCFLGREQYRLAERELSRLGVEGATAPEFAAFSQAGLAIVYAETGREDEARIALQRLDAVADEPPAQLVAEVARVRSVLDRID